MPTALISVSDKNGLIKDLVKPLFELGWEFLASGGTAKHIRSAGIQVEDIANFTGSPEILGGRVKTLHPAVHAGLLARDTKEDLADLKRINGRMIDLVVVNLYPFQETINDPDAKLVDAIENIDIGGVALIRAAAKNFNRVTVVTTPEDYRMVNGEITRHGSVSGDTRRKLAEKAFALTAAYDSAIASYLAGNDLWDIKLYKIQELRYGENPHQHAALYGYDVQSKPMGGNLLHGKPLSYNNLLDLDAAWRAVISFKRPTVCIVKHLSPCGIASADTLAEAFNGALASDPVSAFGSVIATNREFDEAIAKSLGELFVECIAAPGFTHETVDFLKSKKNLRLLSMIDTSLDNHPEFRSIYKGVLQQEVDNGDPEGREYQVLTERQPTDEEMKSLLFAWKACQYVKSNAIVFAKGEATVGIGGGQPNRVDCVHIAAKRAGDKSRGAVMASDAFFPFPDAVEAAAEYGITAIIQPGGSVRDQQSIDAANQNKIAMVMTGVRHFRH